MLSKKKLLIYFIILLFLFFSFVVYSEKPDDITDYSRSNEKTCACARSVEKLIAAQEANISEPGKISKEYRVKKEAYIDKKTLEEALAVYLCI